MMIFNGQTKSLVIFGSPSQQDAMQFLADIQHAVNQHNAAGRPNSGDFA